MGFLRTLLTISFIGIALFLALLLGILLLGVYLVMRLTGALKVATVGLDGQGRPVPPSVRPDGLRVPQTAPDDLPLAPPGVEVFHMRTWDAGENRALDRWYYKDEQGQWIFVRSPGRP
ncbi:MAG: hypothetical protein ACRCUX_10055 [Beijerinckiaceae bacterium]